MASLSTPLTTGATKVMLLGAGELGKEVAIELQRLGCEVIACDRYDNAPAMQVAHRRHIFSMLDGKALRAAVESENPSLIVPEIEAIATDELVQLEREGFRVVPSARAARLTMNREGIRTLAAETLKLPTSPYRFVASQDEFAAAAQALGWPCVIKPLMSSSGKGQSVVRSGAEIKAAWEYSQVGSRAGAGRCIVEGFVPFHYEITLLTVSAMNGVQSCPPIGHIQIDGDYRESWQPIPMSATALAEAQRQARAIVEGLGGWGIFGVEFFVVAARDGKPEQVIFSEVSPRPHDTGLVTLGSQQYSEFARCTRAPSSACRSRPSRCSGPPPASRCWARATACRASMAWRRRSRCPRASCACSASRSCTASAAWAWRWRRRTRWSWRARAPSMSQPRCASRSSPAQEALPRAEKQDAPAEAPADAPGRSGRRTGRHPPLT